MSTPAALPPAPRWSHEPVEETLDDARALSISVADRMVRSGWEALADVAGIPRRRWRRHHPLAGDAPLVALVDGRPAFDAAAWERFASLVPGAVALPTRTADALGVARGALRPPHRAPLRIVDLARARRVRARRRRAERTLDAAHARHVAEVERTVAAALAPGEDGTPLATLPTYALAARLELLLDATAGWAFPAFVDLATSESTTRLLRLLGERGLEPGAAYLQVAELASGGGVAMPPHLDALAAIGDEPAREQAAMLAAWADGAPGWHAARDLVLESPPLREDLDAAQRIAAASRGSAPDPAPAADRAAQLPDDDGELRDAAIRARQLTALRELIARDRATHVAGIRAITWTLARSLHASGVLERVDDAFDLDVVDLLRLARGGTPHTRPAAAISTTTDATAVTVESGDGAPRELRGIPASAGRSSGRVVVLDDPALDADVDGAVLFCRVTDPAWLPLLLRCSGLVTERGGPLSHAAIVARELGLPAVVGVAGACAAATHAQTARIDGATGVVALDSTP